MTMVRKQLYFEDVKVGDEVPPVVKEITNKHLVMFEAASWDFAPGHYDRDYAKAQELFRDIYVDGPMVNCWFGHMLMDWIGNDGRIKKLGAQYRGTQYPGDTITCKGKVVNKYTEGGRNLVVLEIWAQNQNDERTTNGSATVSLPSKG